MPANYLEQLVAEWYEYRGYFVRRNVLVGKRANGGYECELDVVAFHPGQKHLVHVEPSMDTLAWTVREKRLEKKFAAGRKYIPSIFSGFTLPGPPEQIAVLVYGGEKTRTTLGGGKVIFARAIVRDILAHISPLRLESNAIPEHLPILRTFQFVARYRSDVLSILGPRI